ncbi:MAG: DUF4912 domain-containing protein [Candidatus Rokuibacteriota bacterium]
MSRERQTRRTDVLEAGAPPRATPAADLQPAEAPVLGDIPWGYGEIRVTAMPVDPYWVFVYWEVADEAIERARASLGAPHGDCALRVYDTTYRLFDGTNANWYADVGVHRPANNHYVHVGRPGITLQVDLGVRSGDAFAPLVRSAPVEMPRDSISTDTRVEWMTVTPEGAPPAAYAHRFTPNPGTPAVERPGPGLDVDEITRALAGEGWSRAEWSETEMAGRVVRWVRWAGPLERGVFGPVEIVFEGERRVVRLQHGERVVFGPWRVTIRGVDSHGRRRVIDRWQIHYSWPTEAGGLRIETAPILHRILQGYRMRVVPAGSEARLIGESWASEALQLGASEWSWLGSSEARLAGASELLYLGASESRYLGASEILALGASESFAPGASEMGFTGASGFGGASEWLLGGASEGAQP